MSTRQNTVGASHGIRATSAPTSRRRRGVLRDEDLVERIDRELQEILLNHKPEALAQETIREMRSIAEKFRQRHSASS